MIPLDPITLEVTRNALIGVAEEAGAALRRTAYSPNIKERMDCSTALFDRSGELVAQAEHIPVHLGSMPASVSAALARFPDLIPGDQVLLSDPFAGGTHLPDWTLVAPIHRDGGLLGYVANRAHHADVGGMAPGSMPAGATEIYQEGLRIPPIRLWRGGKEDEEVVGLLLANSRTPEERLGDLRAQAGANYLAGGRLRALAGRLGEPLLREAMEATKDHAERAVRAAIALIPPGRYRAEDFMEGDGVTEDDVVIRAEVAVDGDGITVDFSGTAPQQRGSINAPLAVTMSCCYFVLRAVTDPDIPANAGAHRPLSVRAPEGSLVNPLPPAAVAAGNVETSQRIVDVLLLALAAAMPGRIPAASQGTMNNTLIGGVDPRTGRPFTYYETVAGGQGARPNRSGMSGVHTHMTNTLNTPVEALEMAYPLRVLEYVLRDGTGGKGRFSGGDGVRRSLEVLADRATVSLLSERRRRGPWGLAGGEAGSPGRNSLVRSGSRASEPVSAKATFEVREGDVLTVETPGGGGHGPADGGGSGRGAP
ncbi:MAG TPA: hydantoinase B/oxoprolinase family protein [Actinomycetota bacterium]